MELEDRNAMTREIADTDSEDGRDAVGWLCAPAHAGQTSRCHGDELRQAIHEGFWQQDI